MDRPSSTRLRHCHTCRGERDSGKEDWNGGAPRVSGGSLSARPHVFEPQKSSLRAQVVFKHLRLADAGKMKLTTDSSVPVYTIAGEGTARPLPEWLARKRKRSLKKDSEYANRVELLQDFEFEEASQCVRVSEDGEWVMSTGNI